MWSGVGLRPIVKNTLIWVLLQQIRKRLELIYNHNTTKNAKVIGYYEIKVIQSIKIILLSLLYELIYILFYHSFSSKNGQQCFIAKTVFFKVQTR